LTSLQLAHISKSFSGTKALKDINLEMDAGKIFGLLGPNGAGKTTLIRIITNIIAADTGIILFDGKQVDYLHPLQFGYMPEERGLYKKMKVGEQLVYLAQLKGMSKAKAKSLIIAWLERFEIKNWWNKKVIELSKGMQQKIQFISTVVHQPKLIILDEPFSGLDPINSDLIKNEIFRLKENGATIIFSTHRMEQVEEICEDIALINKGEILLKGSVNALKQQFRQNEFELTFKGSVDFSQNGNINVITQSEDYCKVNLNEGFTAADFLGSLLNKQIEIKSFNECLPSIHDLFVAQVGDDDLKHHNSTNA